MTVSISPSISSTRSIDRMKGWRMALMLWKASSSRDREVLWPPGRAVSPWTNLMALNRPPGTSHFQTSPKPPLPSGSTSR
jgi:hypothetical protein